MSEIINLQPYEVYTFTWGTAIKHSKGKWERVILNNGQEIDTSELEVVLHYNGIEFL